MIPFTCPVCGQPLDEGEHVFRCPSGHCFDRHRTGYVNLLTGSSGGNHGDNKLMVDARRDFLDRDFYRPVAEQMCCLADRYTPDGGHLLDAGCGEGWYTAQLYGALSPRGVQVSGVDISKEAAAQAARRQKQLHLAVGSVFHLPLGDRSCDTVVSVFAPYCEEEYRRVLKPGGVFLQVIPLENHLWELKCAVYDAPYRNAPAPYDGVEGWEFLEAAEVKYTIDLPRSEDIRNLFTMTPYYYKTGVEEQKRLTALPNLTTRVECAVLAYRVKSRE